MNKMNEIKRVLPDFLYREIESILSSRVGGEGRLGEIRLSREGRCSIVHGGEALFLRVRLTSWDIDEILSKATHGSLYAHRETASEGYITMDCGIRLGISGRARYDEGRLVGVSEVSVLTFRLPISVCDFRQRLVSLVRKNLKKGVLIYSPPGVGKTTALRVLADEISGQHRLCIIDERGELDTENSSAIILSGYKKALGIEIATRTHSPELLMIDEIGPRDTEPLLGALRCGVPIIATAHAASLSELVKKNSISPLIDAKVFGVFIEISRKNKKYKLKKYTLDDVEKALSDGATNSEKSQQINAKKTQQINDEKTQKEALIM